MIRFKQFLAEQSRQYLYHSTNSYNLKGIKKLNTLLGSRYSDPAGKRYKQFEELIRKKAVSTTRSKLTALEWRGDIVLKIDAVKLSHNYKITPIDVETVWGFGKGSKGYLVEERIIGDIKDFDKYLVAIYSKPSCMSIAEINTVYPEFYQGVFK